MERIKTFYFSICIKIICNLNAKNLIARNARVKGSSFNFNAHYKVIRASWSKWKLDLWMTSELLMEAWSLICLEVPDFGRGFSIE